MALVVSEVRRVIFSFAALDLARYFGDNISWALVGTHVVRIARPADLRERSVDRAHGGFSSLSDGKRVHVW